MNMSVPPEARKRVVYSAGANAGSQVGRRRPFDFEKAAGHHRMDPGRYLILMRQYHRKGNATRSGQFQLLASS
jgi:hypothetical protein